MSTCSQIQLTWVTYDNGNWCNLRELNLNDQHFVGMKGIYIIWHSGPNARVVRIGQGDISSRLASHREDRQIVAYQAKGPLLVTWAAVPSHSLDGVERYLSDLFSPLVGERFPNVLPIPCNLPFK